MKIQQRPLLTCLEPFQGMPDFVARIFAARGVQSEQELQLKLKYLLAPNMKDLEQAVTLIDQAIDLKKHIVIVGDYDADGATSTALMMHALCKMGAQVHYFVPDRFKYGYGLTAKIAEVVFDLFHPDLLITVDNGISSHEGVAQAHALGMQVIITDHHLTTKTAPPAEAVVNPNQQGCPFPSKALAGVGVAFYVLASLSTQRKKQGKSFCNMLDYLDLVALGTYADVASLDYNNRILVDCGVKRIQQGACCFGIQAILATAKKQLAQVTAQDLGFVIGPRLNAAGRMDSMKIGIECLLAQDYAKAYDLAMQLNQLNLERRQVEQQMQQQALTCLESVHFNLTELPASLVVFDPSWHQGVIGIVAGRLKEQFHRPTIVFAADEDGIHLKGSARSIEGIHVRDAIEQVAQNYPDVISHFGGHAAAAGLTIKKSEFNTFQTAFNAVIAQSDAELFDSIFWTDGVLHPQYFKIETVDLLQNLAPWGQKFPNPVFEGCFEISDFRWLKELHLKLYLKLSDGTQIEAIVFNALRFDFDPSAKQVYLVYELDKNQFKDQINLQLKVRYLTHKKAIP